MSTKTIRLNAISVLIILMFVMNIISYLIGKEYGYSHGQLIGYGDGQVNLIRDIRKAIGETVDCETDRHTYKRLIAVKGVDLYIIEKNGIKTLATWKYQPACYVSHPNVQ